MRPRGGPPRSDSPRAPRVRMPRGSIDPARDAACARLARAAACFPEADPTPLDDRRLDERDAAFAHAIVDAALSRWITLEGLLRRGLKDHAQPLEPSVLGALLAAGAQIALLDRVPAHAAVDHAVEWAKRGVSEGAGRLVNAVLRRFVELVPQHVPPRERWTNQEDEIPLEGGGARVLARRVLPFDALQRMSVATGHSTGPVRAWAISLGDDRAMELCLHNICRPPTVLCVAPGSEAGLEVGPDVGAHDSPRHRVWLGTREGLSVLLRTRDDVWVQDSSSSEAVFALREKVEAPRVVLDLCAGQGTKTRQLAACFSQARIVASDPDLERLDSLARSFSRVPRVRPAEPGEVERALREAWEELGQPSKPVADVVLLDVPCTNTGTLARRVEAKYRLGTVQLRRLTEIQRDILSAGRRLLAPGGWLVYSTCSIERAENQEQAAWAARHLGLVMVGEKTLLPAGLPGGPASGYRDGSYHAILRSTAAG